MLRLHLRLVRALQISGWLPRVFHPELVILFRLAVRRLSTETYNLDFEVLQWSKLVEIWGTQNETKIQPPTERLHFTCGQLQLLTSNNSPRNSGTLLMACVTALGAPDSSRRHLEATHEMFSWTRSCEPAAQKSPKIPSSFQFTRGSLIR